MASLKALKIRIGSVKSTQKITKAMKMVAAAKLRRAQEAADAGRPYAERLEAVMASLASKVDGQRRARPSCWRAPARIRSTCSSSRPSSAAWPARSTPTSSAPRASKAEELTPQGKTVKFYLVGKKGARAQALLPERRSPPITRLGAIKKLALRRRAAAIADDLIARFEAGEFDVAHLFYSNFQSVLAQEPTGMQIIPVAIPASAGAPRRGDVAAVEYEPDEEDDPRRPAAAQRRDPDVPRDAARTPRRSRAAG